MRVSNVIQCVMYNYKGESQDCTEKKDFNLADLILELEVLFASNGTSIHFEAYKKLNNETNN